MTRIIRMIQLRFLAVIRVIRVSRGFTPAQSDGEQKGSALHDGIQQGPDSVHFNLYDIIRFERKAAVRNDAGAGQ